MVMTDDYLFKTITTILDALFEREKANFHNRTKALIPKHQAKGGSKDGFKFMGVIYTDLMGSARPRGTYDPLHTSLVPEIESLLSAYETAQNDQGWIKQALVLVLTGTRSAQDRRDALPNCLQGIVPDLVGLQRTREEAYTLANDPRGLSQYMRLRDKIEFYAAARLLY